jgi:predicted phosphodiesterase
MASAAEAWHECVERPRMAWRLAKEQGCSFFRVDPANLVYSPDDRPAECTRFVAISDTHSTFPDVSKLPEGDVLLHAGDFSLRGTASEAVAFAKFLESVRHKYKQIIVICGNHELGFDPDIDIDPRSAKMFYDPEGKLCGTPLTSAADLVAVVRRRAALLKSQSVSIPSSISAASTLPSESELDALRPSGDSLGRIPGGWSEHPEVGLLAPGVTLAGSDAASEASGGRIKVFGTPFQPEFHGWGFNVPRGAAIQAKWDLIPTDADVVMVHGPPLGHGDRTYRTDRAGCVNLLHTLTTRVRPAVCVFGHIHEDAGVTSDGTTVFINAALLSGRYRPRNAPVVFDFPLPNVALDASKALADSESDGRDVCTEKQSRL